MANSNSPYGKAYRLQSHDGWAFVVHLYERWMHLDGVQVGTGAARHEMITRRDAPELWEDDTPLWKRLVWLIESPEIEGVTLVAIYPSKGV